jgi:hypothetical protein
MRLLPSLLTVVGCVLLLSDVAAQTSGPTNSNLPPSPLIIGGTNSLPADYPAVGAVLAIVHYGSISSAGLASGTLIAPDVILSAAHVFTPDPQATSVDFYFSLALNISNFYATMTLPGDAVRIASFATAPGWDPSGSTIGSADARDVGLGFLQNPFTSVEPAALVTASDAGYLQVGSSIGIVGYGVTSANDMSGSTAGIKRQATSRIWWLSGSEIQVGMVSPETCTGDSGGPAWMIIPDGKAPALRVVGVCSYGDQDCHNGIDMRVDAYLDWIEATMRQACSLGQRPPSVCLNGGGIPPLREIRLSIQSLPALPNQARGVLLFWDTLNGTFYNVMGATNLQATWVPLLSAPLQASNQQIFWTNWTSRPSMFYKVMELGSP